MSNTTGTPQTRTGENRGNVLLGSTLAFGITAFLTVTLRIGYRLSRRTIGVTDYCIATAMALSFVHTCFDAISVTQWGYGQHEADLPANIRNGETALKLFYVGQIVFKPTVMFTKLSLFFVYRGLFRTADTWWVRVSRVVNYATAFLVTGYYTAALFVSIFECTPVEKAWKTSMPGTCINTNAFLYTTAGMNVTTSLLIIFIPIPVLLRTKHRRSEIAQLIGLILLGFVDTGASIARMIIISSSAGQQKNDSTWTLINSTTAAIVELNVAIIAASLVVMRPCFRAIYFMIYPSQHMHSSLSGDRSGYTKNSAQHRSMTDSKGIFKTVDVELSSRTVSTEDILQSKDRF